MTKWKTARIRLESALLEVISTAGIFFVGAGLCMIVTAKLGRLDRSTADCLVYVALGIASYLYGQTFAEKKEKELKELKETEK